MDKYINSTKVLNFIQDCLNHEDKISDTEKATLIAIQRYIERTQIEDVAHVVRGHKVTHNRPIAWHWISGKLDGGWDDMEGRVWVPPVETNPVDYCSECGKRLDDTFQHFCPNCGALMDKDGDGDG